MTNMFPMNDRMAKWTQNHQVIELIIIFISVFMMNPKYFFIFIITTYFTFYNQISRNQFLSNRCIFGNKNRFFCFIYAFSRTIFSFTRRRIKKNFSTMVTFIFKCAFQVLCFMITFSRAIFCFIGSTRNVFKIFSTYKTFSLNLNCTLFIFTFTGTIFRRFNSIIWNIKTFITKQTINNFTHRRENAFN